MAEVVAGAGAGFHRMSLKKHKKNSQGGKRSKMGCEEVNNHHLRRAPARLPSASSLARCLLPLFDMEFLGVLVLERKSLG
jgi:hypothetical protein